MNKRMVTFVSIVITVFILGTAAVIYRDVSASKLTELPQEIQDQLIERDQAYNEVIMEANERIEQLNYEISVLQENQQNDVDQTDEVSTGISPEEAANIALTATNYEETLLKLPELVEFEGQMVFEVQMTSGVLYLDALSGAVVFNGVPKRIDAEQAAIIAGEYLGGMDPKYSVVKQVVLNGSEVFQAVFNDYIVFLDSYGNVLQAQYTQYEVSNSVASNDEPSGGYSDDDHDDDHEDEHEEEHDDD
ncbi:MAG: hypothetical protein JEZ06_03445 [Anaerolineaceae bacterium]|nr:hypothetical protein [Anaerolineaceae bacterium]